MTSWDDDPDELAIANLRDFFEEGPGLRLSTRTWVNARDEERQAVLLGGLGAMGVGQMWVKDDGSFCDHAGYFTAPIWNGQAATLFGEPL